MPATMRAFQIPAFEARPELLEVDVPKPQDGQVVVRVAACGLCHSDLSMMAMPAALGEALGWSMPFTLGHETAGWVASLGAGVAGVTEGQPVAVSSPTWCGQCRPCRQGHESACAAGLAGRGFGRDGGLADYVLVTDARSLLPLPAGLAPEQAAPLTDAGATSHHAVARVLPRLHDDGTAVVIGAGGLGAFVIQLLRALSPAQVVAIDPDPVRREVATRMGAHRVIDGVDDATPAALRELLGSEAADVVVDLVGTDATIACGVRALGPGGAYALVGAAGGTLRKPWYPTLPRDGELFTFQGSDRSDIEAVLALAGSGSVRVDTVSYSLDAVADAYGALAAGGLAGRITVHP